MYSSSGGYQSGFQGGVGTGGFGFQGGYQGGYQGGFGMQQPQQGFQPAFQPQQGFQSQPTFAQPYQAQPTFQPQPTYQSGFTQPAYPNTGLSSGGFGAGMNIQGYSSPNAFQQSPPVYNANPQPYQQQPQLGMPHQNSIYSTFNQTGTLSQYPPPQTYPQQQPQPQPFIQHTNTFGMNPQPYMQQPQQPQQPQYPNMVQQYPQSTSPPLGVVPRPLPVMNYNPEKDCDMLRKAMKGIGTDEATIINIVANRTNFQRQEIKKYYKTSYGKDLIKQLKSELSGNFEDVVIGLFQSPEEYDATCLYKAIKGLGTDESTLIEIVGTRVNWQIKDMKAAFTKLYNQDLIKWVEGDTSGYFRRFLVSLLQGNRSENQIPNVQQCQQDAQALIRAGIARWGTDEAIFIKIFALRSAAEIKMISELYEKQCGKSLLKSIDSEFSGDIKNLLKTVVKGLLHPAEYFAERIHSAVKGLGTNDKKLIRVIVTRGEIDMRQIKDAYRRMYGRDMVGDIRGDTSGDYRKILVALVSK